MSRDFVLILEGTFDFEQKIIGDFFGWFSSFIHCLIILENLKQLYSKQAMANFERNLSEFCESLLRDRKCWRPMISFMRQLADVLLFSDRFNSATNCLISSLIKSGYEDEGSIRYLSTIFAHYRDMDYYSAPNLDFAWRFRKMSGVKRRYNGIPSKDMSNLMKVHQDLLLFHRVLDTGMYVAMKFEDVQMVRTVAKFGFVLLEDSYFRNDEGLADMLTITWYVTNLMICTKNIFYHLSLPIVCILMFIAHFFKYLK